MGRNELFAYIAKNLKKLPESEDHDQEEKIRAWINLAEKEMTEKEIYCKGCGEYSKAKDFKYVVSEEQDSKYYHYSHMMERIIVLQAVCPLCGGKQKRMVLKRFLVP